jgi:hypothetical protein
MPVRQLRSNGKRLGPGVRGYNQSVPGRNKPLCRQCSQLRGQLLLPGGGQQVGSQIEVSGSDAVVESDRGPGAGAKAHLRRNPVFEQADGRTIEKGITHICVVSRDVCLLAPERGGQRHQGRQHVRQTTCQPDSGVSDALGTSPYFPPRSFR